MQRKSKMKANGTEAQKHAVALAYFRTDNSSSVGYILKIHVINERTNESSISYFYYDKKIF